MKLEYYRFDFNKNDISLIFIFFLYFFIFYLFIEVTYIYLVVVIIILMVYLLYRTIIIYFLKENTEIIFKSDLIEIRNIFFMKTIKYEDIKNITLRKNYLGSKDIIINFDDTINIYRYFSNYIIDISARKNHKNSYIICDLKNFKEIEEIILEKVCRHKEMEKEEKVQVLYAKHSLIETEFPILVILFLNMFIISLMFHFLKLLLAVYFIFINIKFFKNRYFMIKLNDRIIKISDKRKSIYIFDNYSIKEKEIRVDYGLRINLNYYYLSFDILPIKYKVS